jgi:hypothetical protein
MEEVLKNYLKTDLLSDNNMSKIANDIQKQGYSFFNQAFSNEYCEHIADFVKNNNHSSNSNTTFQYGGTELRVWDAEKKDALINQTKDLCDTIFTQALGKPFDAFTLLALHNKPIADKSLINGRWHIDSFQDQYKAFLYLTDVQYENGPFEFIPETTNPFFKLKMFVTGKYFALKDFLTAGGGRSYSKLKDDWIENVVKKEMKSIVFECKAGTILFANTSCIHRAVPCVSGERITLTCYYK